MNTIGTLTQRLLDEFGSKPITIRTESNVLIIKANNIETRFCNWQNVPLDEIVTATRGCLGESVQGARILLNG